MKNILVCMIHSLNRKTFYIPTGPAFISAALKQEGYSVYGFVWDDSEDDRVNIEKLKRDISNLNINVVMCGGMITDIETINIIFGSAKDVSPSIITVQGGSLISYSPNEAMELIPDCDIGVIGEGEVIVCDLMYVIENQRDYATVKGIIYRDKSGNNVITEKQEKLPDLAISPIPDYESFLGDYLFEHEAYTITSGRSCNFSCTFCSKMSKKYRVRPLDKLFEELDYYVNKYNIKGIMISNEFFDATEPQLSIFCEKIREYNLKVYFMTRISDDLSVDVLKKLKSAGVYDISFGLESADDSILKSMKKGITAELMLRVLKNTKAARINVSGYFIFGDTEETKETIQTTLNFIMQHRDLFYNMRLTMIHLFPGSFLYEKAVENGTIDPLQHIKNKYPAKNISKLSDDKYAFYKDYYMDYFMTKNVEIDLNIKNVASNFITGGMYGFSFNCSCCNMFHEIMIEPGKIPIPVYKMFCECGERLFIDYVSQILNKEMLHNKLKEQKTAFFGIGYLFKKIYILCELSSENELILLNSSAMISVFASGESTQVYSPEVIKKKKIETVIVTVSGAFDTDLVISNLKSKFPDTTFMMWYELGEVIK